RLLVFVQFAAQFCNLGLCIREAVAERVDLRAGEKLITGVLQRGARLRRSRKRTDEMRIAYDDPEIGSRGGAREAPEEDVGKRQTPRLDPRSTCSRWRSYFLHHIIPLTCCW